MKRVSINGSSFAMPFADLIRPLSPNEFAALRADIIAVRAVQQAVTIAVTPNWGRIVVDGGHRATIAEELGFDVPLISLGDLSADEARDRCLALNVNRRHMTPEEQQAARAARMKRVAEARRNGDSIRLIAAREGIGKSSIVRDIKDNPEPIPTPKLIVGTDGSVRRSARRGRSPRSTPAVKARKAVTVLESAVEAIMRSQQRSRLETIAAAAGAPFVGKDWPHLDLLHVILRDFAGGAVIA